MRALYLVSLRYLNYISYWYEFPNVYAKKIFPVPLHIHRQYEPLISNWMHIYTLMLFMQNYIPTILNLQEKSRLFRSGINVAPDTNILLFRLCDTWRIKEWCPEWTSAAVACLFQGSMCCNFRYDLLYTSTVKSGNLRNYFVSTSLNQSGHSLRPALSRNFRDFP